MTISSSQKESQTLSHTPIHKVSQQDKTLIEQKAESLTFDNKTNPPNPYLTPRTSNISIGIDRDKLYETFVLFHNFMNMTQDNHINPNSWTDSTNKKQINLQNKIDQISINKSQELNNQNEDKNQTEVAQNVSPINKKNYDDIPIKSTNENFIDLVERNLLIDKQDDISDNKNKIIKREKTNPIIPKFYKTYQKPFYASLTTKEQFPNHKFTTQKRFALYKSKDKTTFKDLPRR